MIRRQEHHQQQAEPKAELPKTKPMAVAQSKPKPPPLAKPKPKPQPHATGDEERVAMAVFSLGKARERVKEKEHATQQLNSVRRMKGIVAAEAKVKEEKVEDEVVEVEVEAEEMVEETVKVEVEEKVVVVVVGGQWLTVFWGMRDAGAIQDLPWDPAVLAGPQSPNLDHPLLVPPESPVWTLRFLMRRVHQRILGQGRWVWVG